MKKKKLTITEADYLLANRRASRLEEIQEHGHSVRLRRIIHKSKKAYDRNQSKRAANKNDDSSFLLFSSTGIIMEVQNFYSSPFSTNRSLVTTIL